MMFYFRLFLLLAPIMGKHSAVMGQSSPLNLADILDGTSGVIYNGNAPGDRAGSRVSLGGDVNGDGFDDFIISAPNADADGNEGAGQIYIVFGSDETPMSSVDLSALDGTNGFVVNGSAENGGSLLALASGGDLNKDGFDDLVFGFSSEDPNGAPNAGQVHVVYGSGDPWEPSLNLSELDGDKGYTIEGIEESDRTGISVSSKGDVNGDGIDDLVIGAVRFNDGLGRVYALWGSTAPVASPFILTADLDGSNGIVVNGITPFDSFGASVSSAGDLNDDGINDIVIGAPGAGDGQVHVVFGKNTWESPLDISSLNGDNGFTLNGFRNDGDAGRSVSSGGDLNGDDIDDLVIGAPEAFGNERGEVYVVYGSTNAWASPFDLSNLNGVNGYTLTGVGANDNTGTSVSSSGDLDGDDIDDLVIGAPGSFASNRGGIYVVYGSTNPSSFVLSTLNGVNGYALRGVGNNDNTGVSVSSGGDLNGDGVNDIVIGASQDRGKAYVVYGVAPTSASPSQAPSTPAPISPLPTQDPTPLPTFSPTTPDPTTQAPTTQAPTTQAPTTPAPTTQAPTTTTTPAPTTQSPTTPAPMTQAPTTPAPTTQAPTTQAPTTPAPTTQAPTTITESPAPTGQTPVSKPSGTLTGDDDDDDDDDGGPTSKGSKGRVRVRHV